MKINPQARKTIDHARSLLGVQWRHRGRKPWAVDCIGLVVLSVTAAGMGVADRRDYGREPWRDGLRDALRAHFGPPVSDGWRPGDVALMQLPYQPEPGHVGIIADYALGGLSLIHAYSLVAVTEHRLDEEWRAKISEVYRPWP